MILCEYETNMFIECLKCLVPMTNVRCMLKVNMKINVAQDKGTSSLGSFSLVLPVLGESMEDRIIS